MTETVNPEALQQPTFAGGAPGADSGPSDVPGTEQADYFGFGSSEKYVFPDGASYIEFRRMNEGKKKAFQDKTSKDLVLERNSGNARMSVLQGSERHELIKSCVTGWNLKRNGEPIPFNNVALGDFLELADPLIIEGLEKAIRKANPWLLAEMTVKDIDREIENLQDMRKVAEERERGSKLVQQARDYVRGKSVGNPHPIITMFQMCESMKWNHLPVEGGLYDQDPDLLDGFMVIFQARSQHEAEEDAKEKNKSRNKLGSSMSR